MHNTATRTDHAPAPDPAGPGTAPDPDRATGTPHGTHHGTAPGTNPHSTPGTGPGTDPAGDPRLRWTGADGPTPPVLRFRRDGILPTIAAALSVRGETLTSTAGKADQPPALHPLVQDFLDTLTSGQRERFTGRCPEARLLSQFLDHAETQRSRRAARKPFGEQDARRALRGARMTTVRIREDGDPLHGTYAPPCRSCDALLAHFGVRPVDLTAPE